jgi:hypothetical protein
MSAVNQQLVSRTAIASVALFILILTGCFGLVIYLDLAKFDAVSSRCTDKTPPHMLIFYYQLAQSQTAANVRYVSMLSSTLIMLLGAVFVALGFTAGYKLQLEGKEKSSLLQTSSPGLVMISVGAILLGLILFSPMKASLQLETSKEASEETTVAKSISHSASLGNITKSIAISASEMLNPEVQWALALESHVKQGYQPNPSEMAAYENVMRRLAQGSYSAVTTQSSTTAPSTAVTQPSTK